MTLYKHEDSATCVCCMRTSIEPPLCPSAAAALYRTPQTPELVRVSWRRLTQCQAAAAAGVGVRLKMAPLRWRAHCVLATAVSRYACHKLCTLLSADNRERASANVAGAKQKTHVYLTNVSVLCFLGNRNKDGSSWMQQLRQLGFRQLSVGAQPRK